MKYNRPYSRARYGTMAKDFEKGVDYDRLRKDRLAKAQAALKARGLGGVICFDLDNVRYITGTAICEIARDFMMEYCVLPAEGKPFLFDLAVPAKRISAPWMEDRLYAPISILKGALPPRPTSRPSSPSR
jgi:Xaa-Pro dipeptidase